MATPIIDTRRPLKTRPGGGYPVAGSKQAIKRQNTAAGLDGVPRLDPKKQVRKGTLANRGPTTAEKQAQKRQPGKKSSRVTSDPALKNQKKTVL